MDIITPILSGVKNIFHDKIASDDREPTFVVHVDYLNTSFGLMLVPSFEFWKQMTTVAVMQFIFFLLLSVIVYKFIILRRKSPIAFITAVFVVIPACLYYPVAVITFFGIRNKMVRFCTMLMPIASLFRCSEASFGFSYPGSEASLTNYMIYYSSLVEVIFHSDNKTPVRPSWNSVTPQLKKILASYFCCAAVMSFLQHFDGWIMHTEVEVNTMDHKLTDIFSVEHFVNIFWLTLFFSLLITTFGGLISMLSVCVHNIDVINAMNNVLATKSPSDFWGKRWNMVVHGCLKRGVFKPFRSIFPTEIALMATFVASALFHEWIILVVCMILDDDTDVNGICGISDINTCYVPHSYGKNLLFFSYQGVLILVEFSLVKLNFDFLNRLHSATPQVVIALLVITAGCPPGHWFFGDYVKSDLFNHAQLGFPFIKVLD